MTPRRNSATLCVVLALSACSSAADDASGPDGDASTQDVVADAGADAPGTDDTDNDAEVVETFADTTFRIDGVNIIRPTGVGPILGSLITSDIASGTLHGLIQFADFGGEWPTTMTATGNVGQEVDGGYTWQDGVEIDRARMEIDAEGTFRGIESLSIVVPAMEPGATEAIHIPAEVLEFDGEMFRADDGWAIEGTIIGAILESEIADITVNLGEEQPLSRLLGGADARDFPAGADDEELLGWSLEADISAGEIRFVTVE